MRCYCFGLEIFLIALLGMGMNDIINNQKCSVSTYQYKCAEPCFQGITKQFNLTEECLESCSESDKNSILNDIRCKDYNYLLKKNK